MNFALADMPLPLRFRPETPMSDDELMRFCAANDFLRVERDANGEILVMTPAGIKTSRMNSRITAAESQSIPMEVSPFLTDLCVQPMRPGSTRVAGKR
jgi:hypothetical protein